MPATNKDSHAALGEFLRARRERIAPQNTRAELRRRRTPGLRREEVADRCGISLTWYTWIEQGRPVSISPATCTRLAEALQLDKAERAYLFRLAGCSDPDAAHEGAPLPAALRESLPLLAMPAYILDADWQACAWNGKAGELFTGWLDQDGPKDLLRWMFCEPSAQALVDDWPLRAHRLVAEFRADCSARLTQAQLQARVAELSAASPVFAQEWARQDVEEREGGERVFLHPQRGRLAYTQVTLRPSSSPEHKLVMLVPQGKD
ncbi:helix-turn-helix transcriptional regulator [Niveibacterium sp. SC-1]|uniref:helix-turn-helix transcriptional regulator n=1 Tax=Niveibacterium sp. SC-1 TaxID=3135646 RepID=UPI00311FA6B0